MIHNVTGQKGIRRSSTSALWSGIRRVVVVALFVCVSSLSCLLRFNSNSWPVPPHTTTNRMMQRLLLSLCNLWRRQRLWLYYHRSAQDRTGFTNTHKCDDYNNLRNNNSIKVIQTKGVRIREKERRTTGREWWQWTVRYCDWIDIIRNILLPTQSNTIKCRVLIRIISFLQIISSWVVVVR